MEKGDSAKLLGIDFSVYTCVGSGGSRICKRGDKVECRRRDDRGAEWPSAAGASIEAPKAPTGWGLGRGYPPSPMGEGSVEGAWPRPSPENFSILSLKIATFSAFWALFLQFIVHSSVDCLKRFRRKKPLLV